MRHRPTSPLPAGTVGTCATPVSIGRPRNGTGGSATFGRPWRRDNADPYGARSPARCLQMFRTAIRRGNRPVHNRIRRPRGSRRARTDLDRGSMISAEGRQGDIPDSSGTGGRSPSSSHLRLRPGAGLQRRVPSLWRGGLCAAETPGETHVSFQSGPFPVAVPLVSARVRDRIGDLARPASGQPSARRWRACGYDPDADTGHGDPQ